MGSFAVSSKIGNYIHWDFNNYLNYGISYNEGSKPSPWNIYMHQKEIIQQQAQRLLKQRNKDQIRTEIETVLNFTKHKGNKLLFGTFNNADIESMQNILWNVIENVVNQTIEQTERANLDVIDRTGRAGALNANGLRKLAENNRNQWGAVYRRVAILVDAAQKLQQNTNLTKTQEAWIQAVQNFEQQYQQLNQMVNNLGQNSSNHSSQMFSILRSSKGETQLYSHAIQSTSNKEGIINLGKKDYSNYIQELNRLWDSGKQAISASLQGKVAELYAVLAPQIISQKLQGETDDMIQNNLINQLSTKGGRISLGWVGGVQNTMNVMKKENFAVSGKATTDYFTDFDGGTIKFHATQDKIDCMINLEELGLGTGNYKASVKNYKLSNGFDIKVLSGRNIFTLVQEYTEFMNHYLNITAVGEKSTVAQKHEMIYMMNRALLLTMILHALAGGGQRAYKDGNLTQNDNWADVFVINDNSTTNGFKVYFFDDILTQLEAQVDYITGFPLDTTWSMSYVIDPDKTNAQNAYSRINRLLDQLKQYELNLAFSPKVLQNIDKSLTK